MIAICRTLYAQLRANPAHASELVSQLLKGEWVQVLNWGDQWSEIKTEHGYSGWARTAQLWLVPAAQIELLRHCTLRLNAKTASFEMDENIAKKLGVDAFLPAYFQSPSSAKPNLGWDTIAFTQTAKSFLEVPYVWGGKTPFGLDCSGLVQLVMNLNGYSFPRDAWQQAEIGEEISFNPDEPDFEEGDLLYFQNPGKPIHHVAISLGKDLYLHASEWVRINSLDPDSPFFADERRQTLTRACKIKEAHLEPLSRSFKRLVDLVDGADIAL